MPGPPPVITAVAELGQLVRNFFGQFIEFGSGFGTCRSEYGNARTYTGKFLITFNEFRHDLKNVPAVGGFNFLPVFLFKCINNFFLAVRHKAEVVENLLSDTLTLTDGYVSACKITIFQIDSLPNCRIVELSHCRIAELFHWHIGTLPNHSISSFK